jgi:hypothetical protein
VRGLGVIGGVSSANGAWQGGQIGAAPVQSSKPGAQVLGKAAQIIGQHAVFARQRPDGEKPFFQLFQFNRVEIQRRKGASTPIAPRPVRSARGQRGKRRLQRAPCPVEAASSQRSASVIRPSAP